MFEVGVKVIYSVIRIRSVVVYFVLHFLVIGVTYGSQSQPGEDEEGSCRSTHYKLAVGQGECSMTLSEIRRGGVVFKTAVIADMGSSSFRADPKYVTAWSDKFMKDLLVGVEDFLVESGQVALTEKGGIASNTGKFAPTKSKAVAERRSRSNDSETSITGEGSTQDSFVEFLKEHLKDIDYWFVVLSHPDKDHINYLRSAFEAMGENKPRMLLVAGGEWFSSNSTEDVRDVLSLVQQNRDRIVAFFPYEAARLSGDEIVGQIYAQSASSIIKGDPESFNFKKKVGGIDLEEFQGTLQDCVERILPHVPFPSSSSSDCQSSSASSGGFGSNLAARFWSVFGLGSDDPKRHLISQHILQNIYFWSLDRRTANANGQSLVWSHAVDDIGWTFVYTGDAEPSTFAKIKSHIPQTVNVERILRGPNDNLLMMQGMHHGSRENYCETAMQIFKPDVVCFSSGNGASFAHPHYETVKEYREFLGTSAKFWERYQYATQRVSKFTAFKEQSKKRGFSMKSAENRAFILGTNQCGTIRITRESIGVTTAVPDGYIMFDTVHAYEADQSGDSLFVDNLTKNKSSYAGAPFWEDLAGKELTLDKELKLYRLSGDEKYRMKMVEKTVDSSTKKYYFYVLQQSVDEDQSDESGEAKAATED